jgi:hypothetical protein
MVKRACFGVLFGVLSAGLALAQNPIPTQVLPAGTPLYCRLTQSISTKLNREGDNFTASVTEPVVVAGRDVIPVGATIQGHVAYLDRPGRVHGVGEMRLAPEKLTWPDGRTAPLNAILYSVYGAEHAKVVGGEGTIKGPSSWKKTTLEVGALAAGGGLVGAIFVHPVLGLLVGGSGGFADRVRRRGADLSLPQGTELNYQLTRDMLMSR